MKVCLWAGQDNSTRMSFASWRESIENPRLALLEFWIVVIGAAALCLYPGYGIWSLMAASLPWIVRVVFGASAFQWTSRDLWLAGFAVTAGAGLWASPNALDASSKFLQILAGVLLYYAISIQPEENLHWVSALLFCAGLGVSAYFLLTHDFIQSPRKLEIVNTVGRWIMSFRPFTGWTPIHPNYASGIAAITAPFIIYPLWKAGESMKRGFLIPWVVGGLGFVLFAILMGTSRGILLAMASAAGVWLVWKLARLSRINLRWGKDAAFPSLVLIFLMGVVLLLYQGPAAVGGSVLQASNYSNGTRAEVFETSAYLIADFPFTGGGLGSYPALYSQYILGIPHYFIPNSHNMFLDVFIEQGIAGGVFFLMLYLAAIWQGARMVVAAESSAGKVFCWLALAAVVTAFIHGMVDDYLYNGKGAVLALVPVGLTAVSTKFATPSAKRSQSWAGFAVAGILLMSLFALNFQRVRSAWFANMGAVRMAQVELAGFPTGRWAESNMVPLLKAAGPSLLASLEADPSNRTANHRLGLIAMLQMDFSSALDYLEAAHAVSPGHRGITKALGYCYIWVGDFEKARNMLAGIPEARYEIDVYIWWWQTQGRDDLSEKAASMSTLLKIDEAQP